MILNDREIAALGTKMIDPFTPSSVRKGVISYGLSSFGYDIRIGQKFRVFMPSCFVNSPVDPKNFDTDLLEEVEVDGHILIPSNSYALGLSMEYIRMPKDLMAIIVGKSTYARCGIIVNITPLEPGWEGYITLEISNNTPHPAVIYAEEGIAQILFFRGNTPNINYATKGGKYQAQKEITMPIVEK